jgi:hypothetical protein
MPDTSHYEISAYNADGEQLSLNANREAFDEIRTETVWEAIAALSTVPSHGWMHWDDEAKQESERMPIARIVLKHWEIRKNMRGTISAHVNVLERIDRTA